MKIFTLDDVVEGDKYTLFYLDGFGSKVTIYSNAECWAKMEDGAGFTTFSDGYKFVEKDRIHLEVRPHLYQISFEGDEN